MIGSVDSQDDISIYLESQEEADEVRGKIVKGVFIKLSKPKQQGEVQLSVNEERSRENGYGIGVVIEEYT